MKNRSAREWGKMSWLRWTGLVALAALVMGCEENHDHFVVGPDVDVTPPAIPNGVYSITADDLIILRWNPNRETDLDGYHILSNTDGSGVYEIIATIDAFDDDFYRTAGTNDPGDDYMEFWDATVLNGNYYWYAVAAFDVRGNESELSLETVVDIPRPEGNIELVDDRLNAQLSGYDFSNVSGTPQPSAMASTDVVYVTDPAGGGYLTVNPARARIQDYGNVGFDVATYAPIDGWSVTGQVEAILGHTYVIQISDGTGSVNYAKLTIIDHTGVSVDMDWGYQVVDNERELKR